MFCCNLLNTYPRNDDYSEHFDITVNRLQNRQPKAVSDLIAKLLDNRIKLLEEIGTSFKVIIFMSLLKKMTNPILDNK